MTWRVTVELGAGVGRTTLEAEWAGTFETVLPPCLVSVHTTEALDDGLWPPGKALTTATVTFLAATATEAADIVTLGTDVRVRYYTPHDDVAHVLEWSGRAGNPSIAPYEHGGVLVEVVAADYLNDLAAETVGMVDYPAETVLQRLSRVFTEADYPAPSLGLGSSSWSLVARDAAAVNLLEYARALLASSLQTGPSDTFATLYELVPQVNATGGLVTAAPFDLEPVPSVPTSPAPLTIVAGEVVADPTDPDTGPYIIDANAVAFSGKWTRRPLALVNRVEVVLADDSVVRVTERDPGEALVTYTTETDLSATPPGPDRAAAWAEYVLPAFRHGPGVTATGSAVGWEADTFPVYEQASPAGWFPLELREAMAVGNLQPDLHPEGVTWYIGAVAGRDLDLQGTQAVTSVQLRPVAMQAGPDSVTIDELPGTIDTLPLTIDGLTHLRV